MGRADNLLARMRRTPRGGWKQRDFITVLEHYQYQFVRHVNHGAMYRHPELAKHPELDVRQRLAQLVIPKGDELKGYVAEDVVASIDALLKIQKEVRDG